MKIVGSISSVEEKEELMLVAKVFVTGQRAQELSKQVRRKNESNNKKKSK